MKIRLKKEIEITKGRKLKPGKVIEVDKYNGEKLIKAKKAEDVTGEVAPIVQKDILEGFAKEDK